MEWDDPRKSKPRRDADESESVDRPFANPAQDSDLARLFPLGAAQSPARPLSLSASHLPISFGRSGPNR